MNAGFNPKKRSSDTLEAGRFAIGQSVSRKEDPVLLRGEGRYTDDLNLPGQAYCAMVRSRVAHGVLTSLDLDAARAMPGVLAIITAADLQAAGIKPMGANVSGENHDKRPVPKPVQWPLATDRVRYVGDPIAAVIAETPKQAKDAAEAVFAHIDALPAVTSPAAAAAPGAPQIHAEAPGNVVLDWKFGDHGLVDAAFARAAHVTKLHLLNSRIVVSAMEPRSAIASFDPTSEGYTLRVGSQGVIGMRNSARAIMGLEPDKLRVLTGNVGGSFGMKGGCYPEYPCLMLAARQLGRPVKWTDERSDSFLSDSHGRDHDHTVELALDAEGHFLALRISGFGNLGAYLSQATSIPSTMNLVKNIIGVYRTPLVSAAVKCMFTNTTPVGAYRGAGRPEGNYYMERLVDTAAREMGIDRIELRRRNHIAPDAMPYKAPSTMEYDCGDFATVLDKALAGADWNGYAERRADSRKRGKLRGLGIGQYLEVTAPAGNEMGGIRFEEDGRVTIVTGTLDYGQGHASPFAQVLVDQLGVPFDRIDLFQGDSDQLIAGGGTGGSRSIMHSGGAIVEASEEVIEKGRKAAAHILEAAVADIEFSAGRFHIAGTDRSIGIMELSEQLRHATTLPADIPASLDASLVFKGVPSAFPNGCHICEVEIDPDTGTTEVVKYSMCNDFGVLVNPLMVEGQAHGGIVQGIGQALGEAVAYDEDGQFLSGSYMDYAIPRADNTPEFFFASHPVPARTNKLGAKGCGEAGCAGSLPAVMNAVCDALGDLGIAHINMPVTPLKMWQTIQGAQQSK